MEGGKEACCRKGTREEHVQTPRGNGQLVAFGKLKIALSGWSFELEVEEQG